MTVDIFHAAPDDASLLLSYGVRRLLVISGDSAWAEERALAFRQRYAGDWPWIGSPPPLALAQHTVNNVRTLLGRECLHAIFDARRGLDVEALVMLAGTLRAGSWLVLLTPPWEDWPRLPDADSLRWSEQAAPIATPNFIVHLQRHLLADAQVTLWRQGEALDVAPLAARPPWRQADGAPTPEQRAILQQLRHAAPGVYGVTAPRGRGKSTLAGMLTRQCRGDCWVTSPSRAAADVLRRHADPRTVFHAPDALLALCERQTPSAPDWLLIDEAAAIPTPLLRALIRYFPRVLMTTTVQGYEGSGRGFLLKFCASLPRWRGFTLHAPLRWAVDDPLERIVDRALLFAEEDVSPAASAAGDIELQQENIGGWMTQPERLRQCYALLCSAHYRTSPLDLRRLLDAPGMDVYSAGQGDALCGVAWWVDEGGLSPALAHEVWAGRRRPRGNLAAQSLAAHGSCRRAPVLRSRRISRIAIAAPRRRQGIGCALIALQRTAARKAGLDYLSVSFGYQADLWAFWRSCGFRLARIGSHREASSGCYSAMAVLPLSDAGLRLAAQAERQLARDWHWLRRLIPLDLPLASDASHALDDDDWMTLAGFAFAFRPMEACFAALSRLVAQTTLPVPALRLLAHEPEKSERGVAAFALSGKKALMRRWREETAQALHGLDARRCADGRWWVMTGEAVSSFVPP